MEEQAGQVPAAASGTEVGRRTMRKATWRLIPLISIGYLIAYMDRVNISFAALQMNQQLGFSATVYGLGAGLFFLSYALLEIPSNLMLHAVGARRWLARIMVTWGLLAAGMALVRTPWQFYAMRFLLGMAEAGFFPGVIYYLMLWFPLSMRARTISRFYIALPLSSVVMGGLAGWLLGLNGKGGLAGWQWLFVIEGLPAVAMSLVFWFLLPDKPEDAQWLTEAERDWLLGELRRETEAFGGEDAGAVRRTLKNPRVWLLGLFMMLTLGSNYAFTFSAPAIVQRATGWSAGAVGWFIAGLGVAGAASMLAGAWSSDRLRERYWHGVIPALGMAAGFLACGLSGRATILLPALAASFVAFNALQGASLSIPGTFLGGKSAATGVAAINMVSILGGFLGPYWMGWARDLTGDYQRGLLMLAPAMVLAAGVMLVLRKMGPGKVVRRG